MYNAYNSIFYKTAESINISCWRLKIIHVWYIYNDKIELIVICAE